MLKQRKKKRRRIPFVPASLTAADIILQRRSLDVWVGVTLPYTCLFFLLIFLQRDLGQTGNTVQNLSLSRKKLEYF